MTKVWDIKRPRRITPTSVLITELHNRGVTIQQIFAQFYAMEAAGDAIQSLTVADAELLNK